MACTIVISPTNSHAPVYNGLVYKVASDNSGLTKFRYNCYITINSVLIDTLVNAPAPDGYGYFDVSRVVENYVTFNDDVLDFTGLPYKLCDDSYVNALQVSFADTYGDPSVTYARTATSSTIYPFNGSLDYFDRVDFSDVNYLSNTSRLFLTNMPRTSYLTIGQNQTLTFLRSSTASNAYLIVKAYVDDVYTEYFTLDLPANSLSSGGRMVRIPVGWGNSSQINTALYTQSGGGDWNDILGAGTFNRLDVYLSSSPTASSVNSETFTFYLKDDVCKYTPKEIWFMNKLGALESFVFQLASTETTNVRRSSYTNARPINQISGAKSDRRQHIMNVDVDKTFTILSNWINQDEARWLEELIASPITYLNEGGELIPINILTSEFDSFNDENQKLFNLKLEYKWTIKNNSQRG